MSRWSRFTFACVLGSFCGAVLADPPRTEFEQGFIGREWTLGRPDDLDRYAQSVQCKIGMESMLQNADGWGINSFICGEQYLVLLVHATSDSKEKAIDALLLPKRKLGEWLFRNGDCELNGKIDSDFIVLARLGRREKVTWKTGVRAAWRPNIETGKIEELSTKSIVCWKQTPP